MFRTTMTLGFLVVVACGDDAGTGGSGATAGGGEGPGAGGPGGSGAGGSGGSGAAGGAGGATGGAGGASTGGGGSGPADCDALLTQAYAAIEAAKACNPTIDLNECTEIVPSLCCPIAVNPANAAAIAELEALLAEIAAQQCQVDCPAVPCFKDPQGVCVGETTMGQCTEQG
jgi:hypothetical protein